MANLVSLPLDRASAAAGPQTIRGWLHRVLRGRSRANPWTAGKTRPLEDPDAPIRTVVDPRDIYLA
jgi:hypothetical protein